MSIQTKTRFSTQNFILNALPDNEYQRLHSHFDEVELSLGQELYQPFEPIRFVYFPNSSMISVVAVTSEGDNAETGVIGREGLVGIDVLMGVDSSPNLYLVQQADSALRISTEAIRNEFNRGGAFQRIALRYMHALMTQIGQTALCNVRHIVEQRLARWLLVCHDRGASDKLSLTQEFLSIMLGVNRPAVTRAALALQGGGFIKYVRGSIIIIDREGLEDFSCECYELVKQEYDKLKNFL
jgi:CRP-like cAMP-binding protein